MSLQNMKCFGIIHPTFGFETIDQFLCNKNKNKYSEIYQVNSLQYYQPTNNDLKEPSEEETRLRDELIKKFPKNFVDDRLNVKSISLKAFPVVKGDGVSCCLVGDWRRLSLVLKKLFWHTESCDQLLRHKPADARVFAVIDATSGYHQLRVDEQSSKLPTIVTNMGRFTYKSLTQGICKSAAL